MIINHLLFADDAVVFATSAKGLAVRHLLKVCCVPSGCFQRSQVTVSHCKIKKMLCLIIHRFNCVGQRCPITG